ncbi:MAG: isoprenylcysteine carboxylmethyltransferase family protein, partial [Sulfolobales archaeon]
MFPRNSSVWMFVLALVLSTVLTVALFYTTFEVPVLLDKVLHQYFPEVFYDVEAVESVLSVLRPVGYATLAIITALIILGFTIKKSILASLGSLVLYIPTFGYFAYAMFFLTGIGVLRVLWLPLLELSPSTLKLGCIVYLPFSYVPHAPLLGLIITSTGLFVFLLGVTTWLYGKFKGYEIVDFWIYKYSRHPQYLGFILWSLGLLVFVSNKVYVRGAFTIPPALIWL